MRTKEEIEAEFIRWKEHAAGDAQVLSELLSMEEEETLKQDAFYTDISFGTGGLRGIMGAGSSRLNSYTAGWTAQAVANVLKRHPFPGGKKKAPGAGHSENIRVAVAFDSRHHSAEFARRIAGICAAEGMEVFLWPELIPVPCLSFSVRYLQCDAGFMVTSSHNPAKYNGIKVYGPDGCHIGNEAAAEVFQEREKLDLFRDVAKEAPDLVREMPAEVYEAFMKTVQAQSVLGPGEKAIRDFPFVYSPLNGTGRKPVCEILERNGFTGLHLVKEQTDPDGDFPTCPSPNPENKEAMALGIREAEKIGASLFLATDPDCDRVGAAVRTPSGFRLLSGNEMGVLLLDFLCQRRLQTGTMPARPVLIKSIVSTDMARQVANRYGVETVDVLTGFKYVGEKMDQLEEEGREEDFLFSFEESCGCLTGTYARDKDGVAAVLLICEMAAWYLAENKSLHERMEELYREYGYRLETQYSFQFEGACGQQQMEDVMDRLRQAAGEKDGKRIPCEVEDVVDYAGGRDGLPPANVLKFLLTGHSSVMLRPSGTEPKLKLYLSACAESWEGAICREKELAKEWKAMVLPGRRP